MIIGFLGKGGSGKSTLSHRFILHLRKNNGSVLAIDADHNMDLAYNLGVSDKAPLPFLGDSLGDLKKYSGLAEGDHYSLIFSKHRTPLFRLSSPDVFTEKFGQELESGLRIMVAGPHTEDILFDAACSHSLFTPLKAYLPYLQLNAGEFAVIDGTAGADFAGTGIVTGFDLAVIVFEPTVHSIKAAKQIADILNFYKTPFIFAANKVTEDITPAQIAEMLGKPAELYFTLDPRNTDKSNHDSFQQIVTKAKEKQRQNPSRLERSLHKIQTNQEYRRAKHQ